MRLNGALELNVREVGVGHNVNDTPGVHGSITFKAVTQRLTNGGTGAIATNQVLGFHGALLAFALPGNIADGSGDRVFSIQINVRGNKFDTIIRGGTAGRTLGVTQEVVQNTRLVHRDVRELGDTGGVIGAARGPYNLGGIHFIRCPERHLNVTVRLLNNFFGETECLESLHRAGLNTISLADLKTSRTLFNGAHVN